MNRSVMNVVSYEQKCLLWSVLKRSVIVCYEGLLRSWFCCEWSVMNGLFWRGLLWRPVTIVVLLWVVCYEWSV